MIDNKNLEKVIIESDFQINDSVLESETELMPENIISDHMVLQRNAVNHLWGKSNYNGELALKINNKIYYGISDKGIFNVYIPPMDVGGPYEMVLYAPNSKIVYKDVMIGEVILFSGQSNMQWTMLDTLIYGKQDLKQENREPKDITYIPTLENDPDTYEEFFITPSVKQMFIDITRKEIVENKMIRMALVNEDSKMTPSSILNNNEPQEHVNVKWKVATKDNINHASMFAYYFAKELQKDTKMPIGIIVSAWGGTFVSAWVPEETVNSNIKDFKYVNGGGANTIARCYNTFISPILNYKVKAIVWYQGEGQTNKYAESMIHLINSWRYYKNDPNLGFLIVQIPRYGVGGVVPEGLTKETYGLKDKYIGLINEFMFEVRRQQQLIQELTSNTVLSVSIDQGDYDDIHPSDKRIIAKRAEKTFVSYFYESDKILFGPEIIDYNRYNNGILITFNHEIEIRNQGINFEISEDGIKFYEVKADAYSKKTILISKDGTPIETINYIRYGALDYPRVSRIDMTTYMSIYNIYGYPLDQFILNVNDN